MLRYPSSKFSLFTFILFSIFLIVQHVDIDSQFAASVPFDIAEEWQDTVWPYRQQTPWDISTNYSYPRTLEYEVQNSTWLRLDIHPTSGDLVFDMLGDLYCVPAAEMQHAVVSSGDPSTRVSPRPFIRGIPYDSEPRFSPNGSLLAFRSDAGLGVENVWVMKWTNCSDMDLNKLDGRLIEDLSAEESRLRLEGRSTVRRVSNETYRYVSNPRFHPSGNKLFATKWFTSVITRGAPEGWEYEVPSMEEEPRQVSLASGRRIVGRSLPSGMTMEDYPNLQIGPEEFIWQHEDTLIFSKNVVNAYHYEDQIQDIHKGVHAIFSHNVTSGVEQLVVAASPGGASRPELSRDGRTLAFVRRDRDRQILVFKDLQTGTLHNIWDALTYANTVTAQQMGTYPSFAFTTDDDAVVVWAGGHINYVPLQVNSLGEKVAGRSPFPIHFSARIVKHLAETMRGGIDLVRLESQEKQRLHAFKELDVDETGFMAVFQAAGVTVFQVVGTGKLTKAPVLFPNSPYYSPSFIPGVPSLIIHARWSDTDFTSFEIADMDADIAHPLTGLPLGRYKSPTVSPPWERAGEHLVAFIKTGGDYLTGRVMATAKPGLYVGKITLPLGGYTADIPIRDLRFIDTELDPDDRVRMKFSPEQRNLVIEQSNHVFVVDHSPKSSGSQRPVATGQISNEVAVAPTRDWVAFVEYHHVYLVKGAPPSDPLWARPQGGTKGLIRVSRHGGHDLAWSGDGKRLFWFYGTHIHYIDMSELERCEPSAREDHLTFGIHCFKHLVKVEEVVFEHTTDISRLKQDARNLHDSDVVVVSNATVLTMESGNVQDDLIRDGVLVVRGGIIECVDARQRCQVPDDATVVDAKGGFVVPGYIDMHAHWSAYTVLYPARSWEMQTFLSYGVTTLHNPSAHSVETFIERARLESGQSIGPRILTTGHVIFGGTWVGMHEEVVDMDQARSALKRIKAEAGPASLSFKHYQLPSRASRQRLLKAGRELGLLCLPEGGGNFEWDMTYILDGMTTIEHSIPIPTLYDDVLKLHAWSGTGATPTHVMSYTGPPGEQLVWATYDVPNDPKLRRFIPHDILEGLTESYSRPNNSYGIANTAISVAKMVKMGLKAHIGAHGESPMGYNFHAEMAFTKEGGLTNYEVLQAATTSPASTLGLSGSIGSLRAGKLADFLVYEPGVDLLEGPMLNTLAIKYVARGGRVWEADTLRQVWPLQLAPLSMPPMNADGA